MNTEKYVIIILPDNIQLFGLDKLIMSYLSDITTLCFTSFELFEETIEDSTSSPYFITNTDNWYIHSDFFFPRKAQTLVLSDKSNDKNSYILNPSNSIEGIIKQLKHWLNDNIESTKIQNETLTEREIEVLRLVASGITNKEIAEILFISFNTVLTHRKNITSKLGIKTVSGLTCYAIMNGIINMKDVSQ